VRSFATAKANARIAIDLSVLKFLGVKRYTLTYTTAKRVAKSGVLNQSVEQSSEV